MNKQTKIILGLGAVAIALYLYNKNKKSKSVVSDVVTPPTGGTSPAPAPDKMPTPIPDLPKKEEVTTSVYYCKDGTRQVQTIKPNFKMQNPCNNHGGIDEAKTNKNRGGGTGEIIGCGTPTMCKSDEVFVNCRCQKRPNLDSFMIPKKGECPIGWKKIGVNENGTAICENLNATKPKQCPEGQVFRSGGVAGSKGGMCMDKNSRQLPS